MSRSSPIGPILGLLLVAAWLACHVQGVFRHQWDAPGLLTALPLIALQTWLNVGLFIVAHDCMHGSFAPGRPWGNRAMGRLCLALYAGFSFDRLRPKHMAHHAHPGTPRDPDFDADHPDRFVPWFAGFFRQYFGAREFAVLAGLLFLYLVVFRVSPVNAALFWGLPALLSAAQLFTFGTFLPHRRDGTGFADRHNARSNAYPWLASLLTCFHFGYHHEHHLHPSVPWWRLPETRRAIRA